MVPVALIFIVAPSKTSIWCTNGGVLGEDMINITLAETNHLRKTGVASLFEGLFQSLLQLRVPCIRVQPLLPLLVGVIIVLYLAPVTGKMPFAIRWVSEGAVLEEEIGWDLTMMDAGFFGPEFIMHVGEFKQNFGFAHGKDPYLK